VETLMPPAAHFFPRSCSPHAPVGHFLRSTGLGVSDLLDKAGVFDPVKPAFTAGK
jgi:hypothetical protein